LFDSTEHDLIGDEEVPVEAYYGIQTQRAMHNFDITGVPIAHFPELIRALAMVKKAAALANNELDLLSDEKKEAIVAACDELIDGKLLDRKFNPVDACMSHIERNTISPLVFVP
jgi:aspartate ammonia-lyase